MVYKKHCCYGTCNSDSRYPEREGSEGVFFINFPKPKTQLDKCLRWIKCCGRPHSQFNVNKVNKMTFICNKHFIGGKGPTDQYPDPIPATATSHELKRFERGKRKAPAPRFTSTPSKRKRLERDEEDSAAEALMELSMVTNGSIDEGQLLAEPLHKRDIGIQTEPVDIILTKQDNASQTVYSKHELGSKIETMILRNQMNTSLNSTQMFSTVDENSLLSFEKIKNYDKKMKFFTGLSFIHFMALFKFLGPSTSNLCYWNRTTRPSSLDPIEELFITLVRLRRGYCFTTMRHFFNLSETALRCIFTTWLQLLYCHFDGLRDKMFPDRNVLKKFMPQSFKSFKNVRCSIDCTEFFVEMPRNLARQANLYSNYKSHHTFKCLIAVAPNGTAVFVSDMFEGSISDREIFVQSGILDKFDPGDLILADRGFTVKDLLISRQASLNIPPFLNGRDKLTPQEELLTRKIAKARIHVERFNERIKKYRLISGILPLSMSSLSTQAVFVTCCLVNFQKQLAT